eukprot:6214540-Pleurochrysis_carterae.AAC.10
MRGACAVVGWRASPSPAEGRATHARAQDPQRRKPKIAGVDDARDRNATELSDGEREELDGPDHGSRRHLLLGCGFGCLHKRAKETGAEQRAGGHAPARRAASARRACGTRVRSPARAGASVGRSRPKQSSAPAPSPPPS